MKIGARNSMMMRSRIVTLLLGLVLAIGKVTALVSPAKATTRCCRSLLRMQREEYSPNFKLSPLSTKNDWGKGNYATPGEQDRQNFYEREQPQQQQQQEKGPVDPNQLQQRQEKQPVDPNQLFPPQQQMMQRPPLPLQMSIPMQLLQPPTEPFPKQQQQQQTQMPQQERQLQMPPQQQQQPAQQQQVQTQLPMQQMQVPQQQQQQQQMQVPQQQAMQQMQAPYPQQQQQQLMQVPQQPPMQQMQQQQMQVPQQQQMQVPQTQQMQVPQTQQQQMQVPQQMQMQAPQQQLQQISQQQPNTVSQTQGSSNYSGLRSLESQNDLLTGAYQEPFGRGYLHGTSGSYSYGGGGGYESAGFGYTGRVGGYYGPFYNPYYAEMDEANFLGKSTRGAYFTETGALPKKTFTGSLKTTSARTAASRPMFRPNRMTGPSPYAAVAQAATAQAAAIPYSMMAPSSNMGGGAPAAGVPPSTNTQPAMSPPNTQTAMVPQAPVAEATMTMTTAPVGATGSTDSTNSQTAPPAPPPQPEEQEIPYIELKGNITEGWALTPDVGSIKIMIRAKEITQRQIHAVVFLRDPQGNVVEEVANFNDRVVLNGIDPSINSTSPTDSGENSLLQKTFFISIPNICRSGSVVVRNIVNENDSNNVILAKVEVLHKVQKNGFMSYDNRGSIGPRGVGGDGHYVAPYYNARGGGPMRNNGGHSSNTQSYYFSGRTDSSGNAGFYNDRGPYPFFY